MILACVQFEWCSNYCYWTFISGMDVFASLTVFIRYQGIFFTQINQHPYSIKNIINQLCKSPKIPWISLNFPIFPWFSYAFPMLFLWFPWPFWVPKMAILAGGVPAHQLSLGQRLWRLGQRSCQEGMAVPWVGEV
jgi:hypothetical protein